MFCRQQQQPNYHMIQHLYDSKENNLAKLYSWKSVATLAYNSSKSQKPSPFSTLFQKCVDCVGYVTTSEGELSGTATVVSSAQFICNGHQCIGAVITAASVMTSPLDPKPYICDRYFWLGQYVGDPGAPKFRMRVLTTLSFPAAAVPEKDPVTGCSVAHPQNILLAALEADPKSYNIKLKEELALSTTQPEPAFSNLEDYIVHMKQGLPNFMEEQVETRLKTQSQMSFREYSGLQTERLKGQLQENTLMLVGFPMAGNGAKPFCPGAPPTFEGITTDLLQSQRLKSFSFGSLIMKGEGIFAHSCSAWPGMIGAPIISLETGQIVGILNSGPVLAGCYEFYSQLHHWRSSLSFKGLKQTQLVSEKSFEMESIAFLKCQSSLKLGEKRPDMAAFLALFASIPCNMTPFVSKHKLQHNLALFSKFDECKKVICRLSAPSELKSNRVNIEYSTKPKEIIYPTKWFQINLNILCMNYQKIEEKLAQFIKNKQKPESTSKRATIRGKVDLLEMILSHMS